jgi:hypothetical protein
MMEIAGTDHCGPTTYWIRSQRGSHGGNDEMQTWFKTCRTEASPGAGGLVSGIAALIVTISLLGSNALSQSDSVGLEMPAVDLARKVVTNELRIQNEGQSHWMYRLDKEESGRKQVQEILETNHGSLSRLLSIDGRLLDARQQGKENQRMQRLVAHPDEQLKLRLASNKKAEQGVRLFKILPDVFVFRYASRQGDLVKLTFSPNPNYQPPSLEARVFHGMEGEMTVDSRQERLTALTGHLTEDVKFGGGLLGHLDKGGKFEVRQTEVAPGQWEMTALNVDMKGKALLFKTVGVQETESHSDFRRVPDDLTLAEAADLLNGQFLDADNR